MGHSNYDLGQGERAAWNAGRKLGAKRPLQPKQVWAIRFFLEREKRLRDRALFDPAIDSKLRGCDLVKIHIGDVVSGGRVRSRAVVVQQKTGRPVQFELLEAARHSIREYLDRRGGALDEYAFPSRTARARHISTRQYARLVDEWVTAIGLRREDYGTHSLRRTKAAMIYKQTGNLRAVQILLGHTKIETTVRYLGVEVEDALALAESTDIKVAEGEPFWLPGKGLPLEWRSRHAPNPAVQPFFVTSREWTSVGRAISVRFALRKRLFS